MLSKIQNLKTNQKIILSFLSFIFATPLLFAYLTYSAYKKIKNPVINASVTLALGFVTLAATLAYPDMLRTYFNGQEPETTTSISEKTQNDNSQQSERETGSDNTETEQQTYEVLSITDGDTLRISYNGESTPIRLIAVEAPELNHATEPVQCYAQEAKNYLQGLVAGKDLIIESEVLDNDKDQYDRLLRYLFLEDGTNINESLIRNGYAFEATYVAGYKYQQLFKEAQQYAEQNNLGLWNENTCDGNVYTGTYKDPGYQQPTQTIQNNPAPTPVPVSTPTPAPTSSSSSKYTCNCSKACGQMASCEEAYFQLNQCGCSARDGDGDGVPCEAICK